MAASSPGAKATIAVITATQTITPRATPKTAPISRSSQESPTAFIMAPDRASSLTIPVRSMTAKIRQESEQVGDLRRPNPGPH